MGCGASQPARPSHARHAPEGGGGGGGEHGGGDGAVKSEEGAGHANGDSNGAAGTVDYTPTVEVGAAGTVDYTPTVEVGLSAMDLAAPKDDEADAPTPRLGSGAGAATPSGATAEAATRSRAVAAREAKSAAREAHKAKMTAVSKKWAADRQAEREGRVSSLMLNAERRVATARESFRRGRVDAVAADAVARSEALALRARQGTNRPVPEAPAGPGTGPAPPPVAENPALAGLWAMVDPTLAPMSVVPYGALRAAGRLPRSSDGLAVPYPPLAAAGPAPSRVVFVSHRWLNPSPDPAQAHPDDAAGGKHATVCAGVEELAALQGWDLGDVYCWIDFACIDQDDGARKAAGIRGLLGYVAVCDALLIPLPPGEAWPFSSIFKVDGVPGGYGGRAWTRLEAMTFYLVSSLRRSVEVLLYAAGDTPVRSIFGTSEAPAGERFFQRLKFHYEPKCLPSQGDLSVEADREGIRSLEVAMLSTYRDFIAEHLDYAEEYKRERRVNLLAHVGFEPRHLAVMGSTTAARSLDLSANGIDDEGAAALAAALKHNASLETLDLSCTPPPKKAPPANEIGPVGAAALAVALRENVTITSLSLRWNAIGPDGAIALAAALKASASLTAIDLRDTGGGFVGGVALAGALGTRPGLHLQGGDISDGARSLASLLAGDDPGRETLNVYDAGIGQEGAAALAAALKGNTTLTAVDLRANDIGPEGAAALALALKENTSLTTVKFYTHGIGGDGAAAIAGALAANSAISAMDLSSSSFGSEGRDLLRAAWRAHPRGGELNLDV